MPARSSALWSRGGAHRKLVSTRPRLRLRCPYARQQNRLHGKVQRRISGHGQPTWPSSARCSRPEVTFSVVRSLLPVRNHLIERRSRRLTALLPQRPTSGTGKYDGNGRYGSKHLSRNAQPTDRTTLGNPRPSPRCAAEPQYGSEVRGGRASFSWSRPWARGARRSQRRADRETCAKKRNR